jgi:serine/threonine-protein kinase
MHGPKGFGRTVALKCLQAKYARDAEFVKMFYDEARVTSALTHANVVMTFDVLEETDAL